MATIIEYGIQLPQEYYYTYLLFAQDILSSFPRLVAQDVESSFPSLTKRLKISHVFTFNKSAIIMFTCDF